MHVNVQTRFNVALGQEAPYYRFKESYRDIRGNVHSIIVLNVGFEPELLPKQMFKIAHVLTDRFKHHPFKKRKICRTQRPPEKPPSCCTARKT
ncbi:MAG TPA: hypothetical protein PLB66_04440 [Bacteroidales bacterium]|nr:hypothetical protein [Bacteroidales bacterium]